MDKKQQGSKLLGVLVLLTALSCWAFYGLYTKNTNYREIKFLFDTEICIEAYGWGAPKAAQEALKLMTEINNKLNMYSPDSEISLINNQAGNQSVAVSELTFSALEQALAIAEQTQGVFDPTVGPLVKLWKAGEESKSVPRPEAVGAALKLVDYRKVVLDQEHRSVYLPEKGMMLDMGAIAKGYAVDKAVGILKKHNIASALVSAGGNIYALGQKKDGTSWHIGIRDPGAKEKIIGYVELSDQVLDTAGDYERYFWADGKKYGHILEPRTGYPAEGVSSSTIFTNNPVQADALATAVFILGPEKGLELVAKTPGTMAVIITSEGKQYLSPGFENKLHK
jgi:thiamine biosynthesis lipoprotein